MGERFTTFCDTRRQTNSGAVSTTLAEAREAGAAAASPESYQEIEVKCADGHWYKALLLEYDEGTRECEIYFPDPESDHQVHPDLLIRSQTAANAAAISSGLS